MPDELLDVVNDNDIVIAQAMRSIVHRDGLRHRGIHVFLATPEGRLVVQRRGRQREVYPLAYDCSVSEHVKAGEGYLAAAERGLTEELGLQGVIVHPLVKFKMNYGVNDNELCTLYEGNIDPDLIHFDPLEVDGIDCFYLEEILAMIKDDRQVFCGWFVQLISWYLGRPSRLEVLKTHPRERLLSLAINGRR